MRALLSILMLLPGFAFAQIEINTEIFKVVETKTESGKAKQEWVKADSIVPGDKVGYLIRFDNKGQEAAGDLVLNNPIPENTFYIENSARGANSAIRFSADGGNKFAEADKLFIEKNGKKMLAGPKDYTNVRWLISSELPAGESSSVQYVVQVK